MPLSQFWDAAANEPISYEAASVIFQKDHGTAWAGYIFGCVLVPLRLQCRPASGALCSAAVGSI